MQFQEVADPGKFVKFSDVMSFWIKHTLNKLLKSQGGAQGGRMLAEMENLGEALMTDQLSGEPAERAYVDTSTDFKFQEIWDHVIIPADSAILRRSMQAIGRIALERDENGYRTVMDGLEEACRKASSVNLRTQNNSARPFAEVFREKNPFRVQNLARPVAVEPA